MRLLDDATLREELRQKGYQQVQHYTWEQSAKKTLHLYQQLYTGHTNFSREASL
jgi:glycosyltransferase involved in cell wall biosynthesis